MNKYALFGFVLAGLLLLACLPAAAEYYKYRDAEGNIRYTDDWADVPEDQRPTAEIREDATDTATPETPAQDDPSSAANTAQEGDAPEQGEGEETAPVVDEAAIEALNARKEALDREQAELMEAKSRLLEEKASLDGLAGRDVEARQAYEEKVEALNRKIADYQKRQEAFQEEAEAVKEAVEKAENPES